jgi:hypothetical protein
MTTTQEDSVNTSAAEGVALTRTATTVRLRPLFEGNNISFAIGFKHISVRPGCRSASSTRGTASASRSST